MIQRTQKHWIVDEEGAAVVRRIYAMRLNGTSITNIAQLLKRDKVLIPSVYAVRKGLRKTAPQHLRGRIPVGYQHGAKNPCESLCMWAM